MLVPREVCLAENDGQFDPFIYTVLCGCHIVWVGLGIHIPVELVGYYLHLSVDKPGWLKYLLCAGCACFIVS